MQRVVHMSSVVRMERVSTRVRAAMELWNAAIEATNSTAVGFFIQTSFNPRDFAQT